MSIPSSARRPVGVDPVKLWTRRGELAALDTGALRRAQGTEPQAHGTEPQAHGTEPLAHGTRPQAQRAQPQAQANAAGSRRNPTVVLVPGFTGSKEDFLPLLRPLADAGLRAIAYDQLGQFESPGTSQLADYTVAELARDLLEVVSAHAPAHVVGHSLGGLVVRHAVINQPESFASVVLLDSGPGPLPQQYHSQLRVLRQLAGIVTLEQIWQLKEGLDREADAPLPPQELQDFLHRRWLGNDPMSLSGMAEILMTVPDRTDELARTLAAHHIPARVLYGVDDATAWPVAQQQDMARRLAVEAVSIPDAAHSPAVENPGVTTALIVGFVMSAGV